MYNDGKTKDRNNNNNEKEESIKTKIVFDGK